MKKFTTLAILGTTIFALTACGSGEDSPFGASTGESLTDYDAADALLTDILDGNLTATDTTSRTGAVTMTGAVGVGELGDDENLTVIGDLVIEADFDTDTATGEATGFTLFDDDTDGVESDIGGTLTLTGGTISGTDFDANLDGTLTEYEDSFGVALILDGTFADNGGDLVVGGDVTGTIDGDDVNGGFVASE